MTLLHIAHIGIILGWFPGRYTRHKTGIFSWSQYELSHLQNFVLRHIGGIAPLHSRGCPISRQTRTFTHGEISKIFFANFSQVAPHSSAEFAPSRRNPHNSAEPPKSMQNPEKHAKPRYVTSRRNFSKNFFPKFFQKFFPKNSTLGSLRQKCAISKDASMLHREKFFAKFFSQFFWNFLTCM